MKMCHGTEEMNMQALRAVFCHLPLQCVLLFSVQFILEITGLFGFAFFFSIFTIL